VRYKPRRTLACTAVTVTALVGAADASATARLAFLDERPLTIKWGDLRAGQSVSVCNVGDRPARVRARLVGFAFARGDNPVEQANVLGEPTGPKRLRPGTCASLEVRSVAEALAPDPGEYTGVLVLVGPRGLVRRSVTISIPADKKGAIKGLVEEVVFVAKRDGRPFKRTASPTQRSLPLKAAKTNETLPIPKANDVLLGVLQNEGDRARVYKAGAGSASRGVFSLPIRIEGANKAGTYSGTLDIAGTGKADEAVKMKLKVTDSLWWPIGTILAGAAIVFLPMALSQRWRIRWRLWRRRRKLKEKYEDAEASFLAFYCEATFKDYRRPSDTAIRKRAEEIRVALRDYGRDNFLFDRTSEEFKKIVRVLEATEADAAKFGAKEGFGKTLADLEDEMKGLSRFLAKNRDFAGKREKPAFVGSAIDLLKGGQLAVGAATVKGAEAERYTALSKRWQPIAKELKRYESWARRLAESADQMPVDDRRMLHAAGAEVSEAKNDLFAALTAADLDAVATDEELRAAYGRIAYLGERYAVPERPPLEEGEADVAEAKTETRSLGASLFGGWLSSATFQEIPTALGEAFERSVRWLADAATIGFAVATGVIVGLTALYADGTFGTWKDYLTALGLGGGAGIISKGLVDAITQVRRRERG
jgi:hypothetical protein